jgi:hypothetical protein
MYASVAIRLKEKRASDSSARNRAIADFPALAGPRSHDMVVWQLCISPSQKDDYEGQFERSPNLGEAPGWHLSASTMLFVF